MAKNILIVDDDRTITSLLQMLLELDGFSVSVVAAGGQVIPTLEAYRPDAILMDVHLADGSGVDVLKAIRAHPDFIDLPVIMSSGMDVEEQCKEAGATEFILKPYPPDQLSAVLLKVVSTD